MRLSESSMDKLYDLMVSSLICAPESLPPPRALETKIQYARTREGARRVGEIAHEEVVEIGALQPGGGGLRTDGGYALVARTDNCRRCNRQQASNTK